MKTKLLVVMTLAVSSSCAREGVPPPPMPGPVAKETTVRAQVPVRVTWEEVSRSSSSAVVRARIERLLAMDLPFAVEISLPPGVSAKRGRTQYSVRPNVEANVVAEELELTWDGAVPTEDAILKVDGVTGVMGIHSRIPYRFGRPEPVPEVPRATGPHVVKGGRDFGASIPLRE